MFSDSLTDPSLNPLFTGTPVKIAALHRALLRDPRCSPFAEQEQRTQLHDLRRQLADVEDYQRRLGMSRLQELADYLFDYRVIDGQHRLSAIIAERDAVVADRLDQRFGRLNRAVQTRSPLRHLAELLVHAAHRLNEHLSELRRDLRREIRALARLLKRAFDFVEPFVRILVEVCLRFGHRYEAGEESDVLVREFCIPTCSHGGRAWPRS